jgi:hypothetical protein
MLLHNISLLCAVMREPSARPSDTYQRGCHFFDVTGSTAEWRGAAIQLPCSEYSHQCYTKKLEVMFQHLLKTPYDVFYYVEADHIVCASLKVAKRLAQAYMPKYQLITTGIGASGWLFTRQWAKEYIAALRSCNKWCYCPDCIAALLKQPRATTRLVLTQHVADANTKEGLSKNDKVLPRCFQKRIEYGLNKFDWFDHIMCRNRDVTPCDQPERRILYGH